MRKAIAGILNALSCVPWIISEILLDLSEGISPS